MRVPNVVMRKLLRGLTTCQEDALRRLYRLYRWCRGEFASTKDLGCTVHTTEALYRKALVVSLISMGVDDFRQVRLTSYGRKVAKQLIADEYKSVKVCR